MSGSESLVYLLLILAVAVRASGSGDGGASMNYDAPDDCRWSAIDDSPDGKEVSLVCSLRTINSEFDTTNFSAIPSEHTTVLNIVCSSFLFTRSSLGDKSFAHLVNLRELTLEHCKLSKWPSGALIGLRDLRKLVIRTMNTIWAAMSLELAPDSFSSVPQLEFLDLSNNNIWSVPENIFCPMSNLMHLNISSNRLQDVTDLGFREKAPPPPLPLISNREETEPNPPPPSVASNAPTCFLDIKVLDASSNHFVLMPPNGFGTLRRLRELYLQDNEISMVADKALGGLKYLQIIDLSDNKIVALPPALFRDCQGGIKEIYLRNNSISVLAPGLFTKLDHLLALDLSHNHLTSTWINADTFTGLIRMVLLNVAYNRLTKIEPDIFKDLYTLQVLNVQNNMIETISANTFASMSNLHTLVLSFNRITYLDAYSLNGLYVLSLISLDNNGLEGIHPEAFRNCSALQDVDLNGNSLTTIPPALQEMRLLRTIDLGENKIASLEESSFKGMSNLYGLRLIGNKLENITKNVFSNLEGLQILNLARNKIKWIERGAFDRLMSVQAIRLDANMINEMNDVFTNVPSLLWLNISDNQIDWFDYKLIPRKLQWLDLHKNSISELENQQGLDMELSLQTLDASFNKLTKVSASSVTSNIELLFLNDNLITKVEAHTFLKKKNLTRVDLYANQIVSMELNALILSPVDTEKPLPEFYIGGNPFQCDCKMEWLQRINKLDHLRQHPKVMDLESIYCKLLYNRDRLYVPLIDAESSQFLCTYKTHCFALCHCCDYDACDCEMTCPNNCTCYHDESWSANVVECSGAGYTEMPSIIPMDATEVYLDGNNFGELSSHAFIGRKNLKVLYANNSNIAAIYNHTFSGLKRLTVLHLENNFIKELLGFELATLERLRELYLQGNRIHYIDNRTFVELKQLEVLRLDGNRIYGFAVWQFVLNPYLVEIGLADNPWSCDCQYLRRFRTWLKDNVEKAVDYNRIKCVFNNITNAVGPALADFNSTTCSSFLLGGASAVESQMMNASLSLLLITVCVFVVCVILVCGLFYYRREMRVWIYSHCGLRMCYKTTAFEDEQDKEKPYDAYLICSKMDGDFVKNDLAPELEAGEPGYKLCVHSDFNQSHYIADTIINTVDSSKRTILVLSKNFINNEWCNYRVKSALLDVLKERKRRLIIILKGELPMRDVDPDLRLYLQANTCITWGDRQFWENLRFSMPDLKKTCQYQRSTVNLYASVGPGPPERAYSPGLPPPLPPAKLLPTPFLRNGNMGVASRVIAGSPLASLTPPRDLRDQRRLYQENQWA